MTTVGLPFRVELARSEPEARRSFAVPRGDARVILDLLSEIGRQDPSLYYRYSCRSGFCGTCTVLLDGRPVLPCQTAIPLGAGTVHIAPLGGFPVVRDLVVDTAPFADRWAAVGARLTVDRDSLVPGLTTRDAETAGPRPLNPIGRDVIDPSLDCISCGACFAACDLSAADLAFLGPAALTRAMVVLADPRFKETAEQSVSIGGSDGVEGCHGIGACSLACPKGLDPARAIRRLRRWRLTGHA